MMIFGIGFALVLVCPLLHGTIEPNWNSWQERLLIYGFLLGCGLLLLSTGMYFAGFMP